MDHSWTHFLIYISLIFFNGSCHHHYTEMSLAKVTNNLQTDKSSIDFSGSTSLGLSGTAEYSLHLDFLQGHCICFLLPSDYILVSSLSSSLSSLPTQKMLVFPSLIFRTLYSSKKKKKNSLFFLLLVDFMPIGLLADDSNLSPAKICIINYLFDIPIRISYKYFSTSNWWKLNRSFYAKVLIW